MDILTGLLAIVSIITSFITTLFLLKEKIENSRPYLQVTFELIRDNLACIVLRNVGTTPLTIKKFELDNEFVAQLPINEQNNLNKNKITNMNIFPNKKWILCLGVIIPDILENYNKKDLKVVYTYTKLNKNKTYTETSEIDFQQYSKFLVYISEIDELKSVNKEIQRDIKDINSEIKKIAPVIIKYHNIEDKNIKNIIAGYKENN